MTRYIRFFLITVFLFSLFIVPVDAAVVQQIDWCYIEEQSTQAVLHFETPDPFLSSIDSYEFRTESTDWFQVSDAKGGSLVLPNGGYVYLRCCKDGFYSAEWSEFVAFGTAYIITDSVSGACVTYRESAQFPQNAYLSADRITSGSVFETVQQAVQTSRHFELYDIYFLYADGKTFDPGNAAVIRLPLGDNLKRGNCKVYYVDEIGKRMLILSASYDRTSVAFRSHGAGLYFVVDEWDGESELPAVNALTPGSVFDFYGMTLMCGDADGDMLVTTADARIVLRIAVGLEKPSVLCSECADVNRDTDITVSDARSILRYSVGLSG